MGECRLMSIKQGAEYLNIGLTKAKQFFKKEESVRVQIGNRVYIDRVALEEWLERNRGDEPVGRIDKQKHEDGALGIYLISDGEFVKIGITKNLKYRFSSLQSANARELTVIAFDKMDNAKDIEEYLHQKYSPYHLRGEWFDILDQVKDVKNIKELIGEMTENDYMKGSVSAS